MQQLEKMLTDIWDKLIKDLTQKLNELTASSKTQSALVEEEG